MKTLLSLMAVISVAVVFCGKASEQVSAPPKQENRSSQKALELREKTDSLLKAQEYDSALICARGAAEIAAKENDWNEWGKANVNAMASLYSLERYAEAADALPSIESVGRDKIHPDSAVWGDFFNYAAAIYEELGDYEKALQYGDREVNFFEKKGDLNRVALASNNLGSYYRRRGDFDRALDYAESALNIYLSKPDTNTSSNLIWSYGNLSKTYYRKKDFPKAISNARKALEILEQHFPGQKADDFVIAYNDLANAYVESGRCDSALLYFREALRLFEQHPSEEGIGKIELTWHNMGTALRFCNQYDEAHTYLTKAIGRYRAGHPNVGKAYRHLGYIDLKKGNYRGALAWQQKALLALTTDSFPSSDFLASPPAQRPKSYLDFLLTLRDKGEALSKLAEKESNPAFLEAALTTFDIAASVLDSMRMEYQEGSREFWNRETRPIMENAVETAFLLYKKTADQRYLEQAFRYAEKSKALLLAEALRESAAKQRAGIPQPLLEQEKELKIAIAFYKNQILTEQQKANANAEKIARWKNESRHQHRAYENLLDSLERAYPEYFQIKYRDYTPKLSQLRQWLPPNGGLLEYFRGENSIYAFYFDQTTAAGFKIKLNNGDFSATFERFLEKLRDRELVREKGRGAEAVTQFTADASALFDTLVKRIGKIPEKLIVIPDGDLAYLPFELLLTEQPSPTLPYSELPYLLQKTTLRYEYSAGLALQPQMQRKPSSYFAGYAPSYSSNTPPTSTRNDSSSCRETKPTDFPPLANNQKEVNQIAKLFWGQSLTGTEATEAEFKKNAHRPRILHFAMHAFLNDCSPLLAGLVFDLQSLNALPDSSSGENDGLLYAYEIYNLRLNAELTVLSACNTGNGQLAQGEGVMSLARAFKYAGCPNVLTSLWQADDHATAQIMEDFYLNMQKSGMGKDEALRQAKLTYLQANAHNHPFFWGAFVLIGDDLPVTRSTPWVLYFATSLLTLVLLGVAFYFWKRKNKSKSR